MGSLFHFFDSKQTVRTQPETGWRHHHLFQKSPSPFVCPTLQLFILFSSDVLQPKRSEHSFSFKGEVTDLLGGEDENKARDHQMIGVFFFFEERKCFHFFFLSSRCIPSWRVPHNAQLFQHFACTSFFFFLSAFPLFPNKLKKGFAPKQFFVVLFCSIIPRFTQEKIIPRSL